jgi:hypothetical protein
MKVLAALVEELSTTKNRWCVIKKNPKINSMLIWKIQSSRAMLLDVYKNKLF